MYSIDCFLGGSDRRGTGDGGGTDDEKDEARSKAMANRRMKLISTRRQMLGRFCTVPGRTIVLAMSCLRIPSLG